VRSPDPADAPSPVLTPSPASARPPAPGAAPVGPAPATPAPATPADVGPADVGPAEVRSRAIRSWYTRSWRAGGGDVAAVLLFVLLGRTSHHEGGAVTGFLGAAWPFLVAVMTAWAALGTTAARTHPWPATSLRAGTATVATTVTLGMLLRHLAGGGTPASFVAVATTFLTLFLLGWRLAARRVPPR